MIPGYIAVALLVALVSLVGIDKFQTFDIVATANDELRPIFILITAGSLLALGLGLFLSGIVLAQLDGEQQEEVVDPAANKHHPQDRHAGPEDRHQERETGDWG